MVTVHTHTARAPDSPLMHAIYRYPSTCSPCGKWRNSAHGGSKIEDFLPRSLGGWTERAQGISSRDSQNTSPMYSWHGLLVSEV